MKRLVMFICSLTLIVFTTEIYAQSPVFDGAEGCGAFAAAYAKTIIYHVTNLNDAGAGSFREAVSAPNRTVVFDVSGIIELKSDLRVSSNIIVNGQTAPGEGITVSGQSVVLHQTNNTVIRYMRFRQGLTGNAKKCTLHIDNSENIMVDHLSIEFGRWDNLHLKESENVTIQYSIIGNGIDPQNFGCLLEQSNNISIHHCLWVNNKSRNPKGKGNLEFVNNVIYNWGGYGFVGGHSSANHHQDLINNYFVAGPNSNSNFWGMCTETDHIYSVGNYVDLNKDGKLDGRLIDDNDILSAAATVEQNSYVHSDVGVTTQSARAAFYEVINNAGDSIYRDAIDTKIIEQVKSLGTLGKIINNPAEF